MSKQEELLNKIREDCKNLGSILETHIRTYIIVAGTEDLEKLLNDIFDDLKIKTIKLIPKYKYRIYGKSPIKAKEDKRNGHKEGTIG